MKSARSRHDSARKQGKRPFRAPQQVTHGPKIHQNVEWPSITAAVGSTTQFLRVPSWRRTWSEVIPFFAFPDEVRRIVYTTNAIEALNSKLRRAVRARGHFPSDDAATKLLYLILNRSEKEWKIPPREWAMAKAQFAVIFGERFIRAVAA